MLTKRRKISEMVRFYQTNHAKATNIRTAEEGEAGEERILEVGTGGTVIVVVPTTVEERIGREDAMTSRRTDSRTGKGMITKTVTVTVKVQRLPQRRGMMRGKFSQLLRSSPAN